MTPNNEESRKIFRREILRRHLDVVPEEWRTPKRQKFGTYAKKTFWNTIEDDDATDALIPKILEARTEIHLVRILNNYTEITGAAGNLIKLSFAKTRLDILNREQKGYH